MDTEKTRYLITELALNNSQLALKQFYDIYSRRVYRYVLLLVKNYSDADEIVSDVFFTVWKNRKKLLEVDNILPYLFKISKFKSIDRLRMKKVPVQPYGSIDVELFSNVMSSPEDKCISSETVHEIDMAIECLPPKCKLAFKLVREDKMSHKEAAELLDISVKTLQNHLCLAVQKIRSVLVAKGISCN